MERGFLNSSVLWLFVIGWGMAGVALAASATVHGPLTSVAPCTNPSGYVLSVASSSQKYIFKTGTTTVVPFGVVPTVGQSVFLTIGATTTCDTRVDGSIVVVSAPLAAYFSGPPSSTLPPPPGGSGSGGNSSGNNNLSQLQAYLQGIFNRNQTPPPTAPPTSGGNTGGTQGGQSESGNESQSESERPKSAFSFGGLITTVLPCDPLQSFPTGTLTIVTVIKGKPGIFTYGPYTKNYRCTPPLPGQNIVGSYMPGAICDLCPGPQTYCPKPALGWMDMLPGIGVSGCVAPPKDCTPAKPTPSKCGPQSCFNQVNYTTAYFPGIKGSGVEGGDIDARGGRPYTIQDCIDDRAAKRVCKPITVAKPQGLTCISLGTTFTWPGLVEAYNKKYGLDLPLDTKFVANDHYAKSETGPKFDVAVCASHNTRCFEKNIVCTPSGCTSGSDRAGQNMRNIGSPQSTACPGEKPGAAPPPSTPASGDCAQGPAPQKPIPGSCPQSGAQITDYASKQRVEIAVRGALSDCSGGNSGAGIEGGIKVRDSRGTTAPCRVGQDGVAGRCTDVSRLQCTTNSALCNLYAQCGGYTVIGGSEAGHNTHDAGNAVDIVSGGNFDNSISQCIESKFRRCGSRSGTPIYCDASGNTYWEEHPGGANTTTGSHWHVCMGGRGC